LPQHLQQQHSSSSSEDMQHTQYTHAQWLRHRLHSHAVRSLPTKTAIMASLKATFTGQSTDEN
jgi:hypothetical protein